MAVTIQHGTVKLRAHTRIEHDRSLDRNTPIFGGVSIDPLMGHYELTQPEVEKPAKDLSYYTTTDWFVKNVIKALPFKGELCRTWAASKDEYAGRARASIRNRVSQRRPLRCDRSAQPSFFPLPRTGTAVQAEA